MSRHVPGTESSMQERVSIPVSLPRPKPTVSYWQDPPSDIADRRSTSQLPGSADIVIIGSGISGASIAYNVLSQRPLCKVVMLEARQACSGATGRNGGHTRPDSYGSILGNVEALGLEEALKITRLEYNCMQQIHAFAREHNIDCDAKLCEIVDLIYDQAQWDAALKAIKLLQKLMKSTQGAAGQKIWTSAEAAEKFLCKGTIGALTYEAGSVSGYKFVIGVLKLALDLGLNLQTNIPATSLKKENNGGWTIETPRGLIRAANVILATNGYTAYLYPKLQGKIVPLRGQITAHRPGSGLPNGGCLDTTYSFIYANGFDYMIPRPSGSLHAGDIIIGGGLVKAAEEGLDEYGKTDDQTLNPDVSNYLQESTKQYFDENWGLDAPQGRIRKEWTGIMGYSPDGYPMIGELPGEKDLWICASFQGHGMVMCFVCAQALTAMMFGNDGKELDAWFPRAFRINEARLKLDFRDKLNLKLPSRLAVKAQL